MIFRLFLTLESIWLIFSHFIFFLSHVYLFVCVHAMLSKKDIRKYCFVFSLLDCCQTIFQAATLISPAPLRLLSGGFLLFHCRRWSDCCFGCAGFTYFIKYLFIYFLLCRWQILLCYFFLVITNIFFNQLLDLFFLFVVSFFVGLESWLYFAHSFNLASFFRNVNMCVVLIKSKANTFTLFPVFLLSGRLLCCHFSENYLIDLYIIHLTYWLGVYLLFCHFAK